ncbi:cyclic nucleotide-gated ion channel 1 [Citrus sinensis]|uniref:Cyclic nucleotide-gated ion channel 1 n=1 Tax=Citrus sinensis TaxID=2711 RepID=A0ACB8N4J5_CITSI|nr:cyclic nucleotide-gated ion channel 1 [Citrus sinensis]
MIFNFGIFQDAPQSGIVEVMDFPQKFFHSFQWGLQNLSGFGQNLQTSSYVWENIFAVFITISSLVLFLFLIGNIQSKTMRSEEMRLKLREIEQWMPYQKLSKDLQQQVKKHQGHVWRETRGVDVENFLNTLPKNLKRNINRELFSHVLLKEGDPVSEIFITQGQLLSMETTNRKRTGVYLTAGDFLGEELFIWALETQSSSDNLPISTRTVRTLTEVEGLALMADDLKFAASRFRQMNGEQPKYIFRYYAPQWRTWAACFIQAAWRRYRVRRLKESMRGEISRLRYSSPSLGGTIYASRFAATMLRATRPIGTRAFTGESSCHATSEVSAEEQ